MQNTGAADPIDIRNWQRRSCDVTTSGKLEAHDPARLAAIGVRHVINLAMSEHPEALADEEVALAACGIGYTHIPVPFDAPTPAHYEMFRQTLSAADWPVHVHCIMNWRVSAFFYLLDLENGTDERTARSHMNAIWDPLTSDDPRAKIWGKFIEETS